MVIPDRQRPGGLAHKENPKRADVPDAMAFSSDDLDRVVGVPIEVRVEIARKTMTIAELLDAAPGQVVMLDRLADEEVDIYAADKLVGQGQVVVVDEEFGVRVTALYDRGDSPADDAEKAEIPAATWGG
jgi:flagellar motor switch protein FliN/FliY